MKDYSLGKIYKIWSPSTDDIYIGSTCEPTLARRMAGHRGSYNWWLTSSKRYMSSYEILKHGDACIELIEECPCESQDQLRAREGHFIRSNNCVNMQIPARSQKEYRTDNKEKLAEKMKEYNSNNQESIRQQRKQAYLDRREEMCAKQRLYRNSNKEQITALKSAKVVCECGSEVTHDHIARHKQSKKHLAYLEQTLE